MNKQYIILFSMIVCLSGHVYGADLAPKKKDSELITTEPRIMLPNERLMKLGRGLLAFSIAKKFPDIFTELKSFQEEAIIPFIEEIDALEAQGVVLSDVDMQQLISERHEMLQGCSQLSVDPVMQKWIA